MTGQSTLPYTQPFLKARNYIRFEEGNENNQPVKNTISPAMDLMAPNDVPYLNLQNHSQLIRIQVKQLITTISSFSPSIESFPFVVALLRFPFI